jgi:hypothetical protein
LRAHVGLIPWPHPTGIASPTVPLTLRDSCDPAVNFKAHDMTRKHFTAIAQAIRQNIGDTATRNAVATALLPALKASNPNFNAGRFLSAAVGID